MHTKWNIPPTAETGQSQIILIQRKQRQPSVFH